VLYSAREKLLAREPGPEGVGLSEHVGATTTEVEIFGATYVIRGGQEPAYLTELAVEVDRRMRELAGHVAQAEPGRLAILAALNLADELSRNRRSWDGERGAIEARVTELSELLDRALLGKEKSVRKRTKAPNKNESRGTP
jgi:cell division protein ZapA